MVRKNLAPVFVELTEFYSAHHAATKPWARWFIRGVRTVFRQRTGRTELAALRAVWKDMARLFRLDTRISYTIYRRKKLWRGLYLPPTVGDGPPRRIDKLLDKARRLSTRLPSKSLSAPSPSKKDSTQTSRQRSSRSSPTGTRTRSRKQEPEGSSN